MREGFLSECSAASARSNASSEPVQTSQLSSDRRTKHLPRSNGQDSPGGRWIAPNLPPWVSDRRHGEERIEAWSPGILMGPKGPFSWRAIRRVPLLLFWSFHLEPASQGSTAWIVQLFGANLFV